MPGACLGQVKRLWHSRGTKLDWPWHRSEDIKILILARGARQQDFEGLLWGQRIWQPRPISYQAQGPRRGGRNVRGRTKKVQTVRRRCRGQSCPWQIKVTEGKSGTPLKTASPGALNKKSTNTVGQPWEHGGGAILGESCHLPIKCPQLTSWPHLCGHDPWTVLSRSLQLTERQKKWLMGHALKYGHGWLTSVEPGWSKKNYIM